MDALAFDLQSAAEEEARMASMSADERKKYKQKQRKACPAKSLSCKYMTCLSIKAHFKLSTVVLMLASVTFLACCSSLTSLSFDFDFQAARSF